MKLADLLGLNTPCPRDLFEALIRTRAQSEMLNKRTIELMTAAYPDYVDCVATLGRREEELSSALGSFGPGGEA